MKPRRTTRIDNLFAVVELHTHILESTHIGLWRMASLVEGPWHEVVLCVTLSTDEQIADSLTKRLAISELVTNSM
eukprot:163301-Amphidinium_carterae.1